MKEQIAKAIVKASTTLGLDLELRDSYSGRGMYGSTTVAVVGDQREFLRALCFAAANIEEDTKDDEDPVYLDDFMDEVGSLRTDNMGRTALIWY